LRRTDLEEDFENFNIISNKGMVVKAKAESKKNDFVVEEKEYDMNSFNLFGWYCPCCNWAKDSEVETRFVKCSRCNRLACGSRIFRQGEVKIFRCAESCGRVGEIGGTIDTYTAAASVVVSMNYDTSGELLDEGTGDQLPKGDDNTPLLS
jgi:hypothetical protein